MASISSPGTGSGIDVNALVSQLVAAQSSRTSARLDVREEEFGAQFSALGQLKSGLSEFRSNLSAMTAGSAFTGVSATSSSPETFSAKTTGNVLPGTFQVKVEQLASAQKLSSVGLADAQAPTGTGTLTFASGAGTFSVTISEQTSSLAALRDAINAAPGNSGVRARIVTADSTGGTAAHLSIEATATGQSNNIAVSVLDADGNSSDASGLSRFASSQLSEITEGADASVIIDGRKVTSATNTVVDSIEGVELTLVGADSTVDGVLTLASDPLSSVGLIESFIDSYNALRTGLNRLTAFDPATGESAALQGDTGVRRLTSALQRAIGSVVDGVNAPFSSLGEIGISTTSDGTLTIDGEALRNTVEANPEGLEALFNGTDGIVPTLRNIADSFARSGGTLDARGDALLARLDDISGQRERLDRRMTQLEASLSAKFAAMDSLVSQLQGTSGFLFEQLGALRG